MKKSDVNKLPCTYSTIIYIKTGFIFNRKYITHNMCTFYGKCIHDKDCIGCDEYRAIHLGDDEDI